MPAPAPHAAPGAHPPAATEELAERVQLEAAIAAFIEAALHPAALESTFSHLALRIHRYQRRHHPLYARFCEGLPEPASWKEIPALPQSAFKQARIATFPAAEAQAIFRTSGTTGETRGEHYFPSTALYEKAILAGWDRLPLPAAAQLLILTPQPEDAPHSSLSHMMGALAAQRGCPPAQWCIAPDGALRIEDFLSGIGRHVSRGTAIGILGTALAFLALFERLGARRIQLPHGSFAIETGGFKGTRRDIAKADLYAMFTEYLGLPPAQVWNEYGMTELSSQFYTRGLDLPHTAGPWVRAIIIDPETGLEAAPGATGLIRIIDLANLASCIAIETQDLAIRHEDGFFLLGRSPTALPRGCSRAADEALAPR